MTTSHKSGSHTQSENEERFLSSRVKNIEESQTLQITGLAKRMIDEGFDVISLSAGEPDFPTPDFICAAGIRAIEDGFTKYTANAGIPELRRAISEKLLTENHLKYGIDEIMVSSGGKQTIANTVLSLCGEGDEVIIPAPYWVSFPEMVHLADATPIILHTDIEHDFKITPAQLEKAITARTKLFIFNSPSNPTGSVYSEMEIRALMNVLIGKDIFIISDEMYEYLIFGKSSHFSPAQIPELRSRIITSNGLSKAYSMTGWRIGYIAGPKWVIEACGKIQSQTTSNASSISQKAGVAALRGDQSVIEKMRIEFQRRRDYMYSELNLINGIKANKPEGAFYIFPSVKGLIGKSLQGIPINSSVDFARYLLEKHYVATVPGDAFGAPDYLRLSYASSMEDLTKAISRIKTAVG